MGQARLGEVAHAGDDFSERRASAQVAQREAQHHLLAQRAQRAFQPGFVLYFLCAQERAHCVGVKRLLDGGERGAEQLGPRCAEARGIARKTQGVLWKTLIRGHFLGFYGCFYG